MATSLADRVLTMTPNEIRNGLTDVTRRAEEYMDGGYPDRALPLYTDAITYLSQMAWFGHPLEHAFTILTNADTRVPSDAAACAVACEQYEKALELLENGRCTFWTQSQYLSLDLAKIREQDPDLARELDRVGKQLDADPTLFAGRYDLATDYNKLILAARKYVPDFAYPPTFAQTYKRLQQKTVALLVASRYFCFALVIKPHDTEPRSQVEHIPLPFITWSRVFGMSNSLKKALSGARREVRGVEPSRELVRSRPAAVDIDLAMREILATLWTAAVLPILSRLKIHPCEPGGTPSARLWWCATGPFSFLPIHAAGTFMQPVKCCLDYVVSSYTPNLSALPLDRTPAELPLSLATMGDVHTPGQILLPSVEAEIQQIRSMVQTHASEIVRFYKVDLGPSALERRKSIEGVLDRIRRTDIIHFASHASQNISNPFSSAIYLPSCSLTIEQLWRFKFQRHSRPRLVVMSACQTAAGAKDLPNEVVHLAGTLVFAGVPSIVGTMWSIIDADGPTFASAFYQHLFERGADLGFVAEAVHTAVQNLRAEGLPFSRWVPFLHMGN